MTDLRQAAQMALEALESRGSTRELHHHVITTLRAAIRQQAEPILTHRITSWGHCGVCRHDRIPGEGCARQECPDSPQQQAEPVAWVCYGNVSDEKHAVDYQQEDIDAISVGTMLYPSSPQHKPLSDEEIKEAAPAYAVDDFLDFNAGVRFAEAAHGIKENT